MQPLLSIKNLSHEYKNRKALSDLSFEVAPASSLSILGPNGSGKSTLFRILSTWLPLQTGEVTLLSHSLRKSPHRFRENLGVVFQSPSLDKKLTVLENLKHQGHLYGLCGKHLTARIESLLDQFSVRDRSTELVEKLSGGLQRRVEIAKSLIHNPPCLLLDEPSTGIDPQGRRDLWHCLRSLHENHKTTILTTTHLISEAEDCDSVLILDGGESIAWDSPANLMKKLSPHILILKTNDSTSLQKKILETFQLESQVFDEELYISTPPETNLSELTSHLLEKFSNEIKSTSISKVSLEDVFLKLTGRQFE